MRCLAVILACSASVAGAAERLRLDPALTPPAWLLDENGAPAPAEGRGSLWLAQGLAAVGALVGGTLVVFTLGGALASVLPVPEPGSRSLLVRNVLFTPLVAAELALPMASAWAVNRLAASDGRVTSFWRTTAYGYLGALLLVASTIGAGAAFARGGDARLFLAGLSYTVGIGGYAALHVYGANSVGRPPA